MREMIVTMKMATEVGTQKVAFGKRRKNSMTAAKNSDMVIILQVLVFNLP